MKTHFEFGDRLQNETLKSKSGKTPEDLFDILVAFRTTSVDQKPLSFAKRKIRGTAKNALRIVGASDEQVSHLLPTYQARLIKREIDHLSEEKQLEFMEKLCSLERDRVFSAIRTVIRELDDDNLVAVQTIGSINANNRWANDLDVNLIVKEYDRKLARIFKERVQAIIVKKVDIKNILLEKNILDSNLLNIV